MAGEIELLNGNYVWKPVVGQTYWLGYHTGDFGTRESVHARYFGVADGNHVFFREKEGKVFGYVSPIGAHVEWYGDCGDDEPSLPAFRASRCGEIHNLAERAYIIDRLKGKKHVVS